MAAGSPSVYVLNVAFKSLHLYVAVADGETSKTALKEVQLVAYASSLVTDTNGILEGQKQEKEEVLCVNLRDDWSFTRLSNDNGAKLFRCDDYATIISMVKPATTGIVMKFILKWDNKEMRDYVEVWTAFPRIYTTESSGERLLQIFSAQSLDIVGDVKVQFLMVLNPSCTSLEDCLTKRIGNEYFNSMGVVARPLVIGHRGMGANKVRKHPLVENTVASIQEAMRRLTKDHQVVVYHDFDLSVGGGDSGEDPIMIPVSSLTQAQLEKLRKPYEVLGAGVPFPPLEQLLESLKEYKGGLNIEVKFPGQLEDGRWECALRPTEMNLFCEKILGAVQNALPDDGRPVVFSTFEPNIALILKLKQHRFPVLFLTQGAGERYPPFRDHRARSGELAVHFASAFGLAGVSFHAEELVFNEEPVRKAKERGLLCFAWGQELNSVQTRNRMKLWLDGIIYDNVFMTMDEGDGSNDGTVTSA